MKFPVTRLIVFAVLFAVSVSTSLALQGARDEVEFFVPMSNAFRSRV